jgi:16S rRNA (guanine527-N7)-methyltransferase
VKQGDLWVPTGDAAAARKRTLDQLRISGDLPKRLDSYIDLLSRWRRVTNLVSDASPAMVWMRHVMDSAQLLDLVPNATRWLDIGSGAGFPGMVIAILLSHAPGAVVHCVESDRRKCAFLRQVARSTAAPAEIHCCRVETLAPTLISPVDVVTARALWPLPKLFEFSKLWIERGAVGVFPRGKTLQDQLRALTLGSDFIIDTAPSRTDANAGIVLLRRAT